jgi:dual specificity protein kinase YAK1
MDSQQWSAYSAEAPAAARPRYSMASPQHAQQRDAGVPSPQIKQEIKQEGYASSMPPSRQSSMGLQPASGTTSRGPDYNDADGDVAMDDADPYKPKYNMSRPSHQHRHSQQFLQQEESAAARRYSPMNLTSFTPQAQPQSQPQSNRQSPTRNNPYMSPPNSYYSPPCTSRSGWQGFLLVSTY